MTTKASTTATDMALVDLIEVYLTDTGNWRFVPGVPYLAWVDLRSEAMGDGRAVSVGDAVMRQLRYEQELAQ
jgi:hypothetical protein